MFCVRFASAQSPAHTSDTASADARLDNAIAVNVLTTPDASPFHAILEITSTKPSDPNHTGRIEIFWAEPRRYALKIDSPDFHQNLIISGYKAQESDEGDFYPAWLQDFVAALLDPLSRASYVRGHPNAYPDSPNTPYFCIDRDDRRNNVMDATDFARICFGKTANMQLAYVSDFTHFLQFENFQPFHAKIIARSYEISTHDGTDLRGTISLLEDWRPVEARLSIVHPTPPSARILTSFVSRATAESLLDASPKGVPWAALREGPVEGNIVVHAVTDRTGQVREASQYESDNNALSGHARELALQYKFKPLLVDGAPQQMEMPIIVHFKTTIGTPIPERDDAWLRSNAKHCTLPTQISRPSAAGQQVDVVLRIGTDGKLHAIHGADNALAISLFREFPRCSLPPVMQDGQPSEYLVHLKLAAH